MNRSLLIPPLPWVPWGLTGAPVRDRGVRGVSRSVLTLAFERKGISEPPSDYTCQAGFIEGCSAIPVAFP